MSDLAGLDIGLDKKPQEEKLSETYYVKMRDLDKNPKRFYIYDENRNKPR